MAQQTDADQTDVSAETEIAAQRIEADTEYEVMARDWPSKDHDVLLVQWENDMPEVNQFTKARIINDVVQSRAAVELDSTEDGDKCVVFKVRE